MNAISALNKLKQVMQHSCDSEGGGGGGVLTTDNDR